MNVKQLIGTKIAENAKDGDCIGIGTGSTAEEVIKALGKRIKSEKLNISGVSTSVVSTNLAMELGMKILPVSSSLVLNWGFDGADEVGPDGSLIKGKGGAMFKEKIVAGMLQKWIVAVTEDKLVTKLGTSCSLPIEVAPIAVSIVKADLLSLGATEVSLRSGSNFYGPLFTENGNNILDAKFLNLDNQLAIEVKNLTGVLEHGYFPSEKKTKVMVVKPNGEIFFLSSSVS